MNATKYLAPATLLFLSTAAGCISDDGSNQFSTSGSMTASAGTTDTTDTTGASTDGPREPIANSVLVSFVDAEGNALPGAWIKPFYAAGEPVRPVEPVEPDVPVPLTAPLENLPVLTADSAGHVLVEAMQAGEQRWLMGAPGYATRTEVFSIAEGTRTGRTAQLTKLGETFMLDTHKPKEISYKNVDLRIPAGHMVNKRTGEWYEGPVAATVTVIDPAAGTGDSAVVPLVGIDMNGDDGLLLSLGMVGVELRNPDNDELLELSGEVSASVSFTLGADQTEFIDSLKTSTIPAWHADPAAGEVAWREIGVFFLEKNEQGIYRATTHSVTGFSWVNFDLKVVDPRCSVIKVVDGEGNPLQGQMVTVDVQGNKRVGPTGVDGTLCYEQTLGTTAVVSVPPNAQVVVKPVNTDPISVCAENNRENYKNTTHGDCTEVIVTILDDKVCVPGATWACDVQNPLPEELDGIGICKSAYMICDDKGSKWSDCLNPVYPEMADICEQDVLLDDDCNGQVNDGCVGCTEGETKPCYTGNLEDDIEKWKDPNIEEKPSCKEGETTCTDGTWGKCLNEVLPNPEAENCDPKDDVESCKIDPCTFAPLWWDSMGKSGLNRVIAVHLEESTMNVVSEIVDGSTSNYASCLDEKPDFDGFVIVPLSTKTDNDEPVPQECSAGGTSAFIEGKVTDVSKSKADSNHWGVALASQAGQDGIAPDKSMLLGCNIPVPMGTSFIERLSGNNKNVCLYRLQLPDGYEVNDVAVGIKSTQTFAAITIPEGKSTPIENCKFLENKNLERSYYIQLEVQDGVLKCKNSGPYPGETPAAITVNTTLGNGTFATASKNDVLQEVYVRTFTNDLKLVNEPQDPIVTTQLGEFNVLDIALASGNRVAVTGNYTGTVTAFGTDTPPAGNNDSDMLLAVADPLNNAGKGSFLTGSGSLGNDHADHGKALKWVTYQPQKAPYDTFDALLVSGVTFSDGFAINKCFTESNPNPGVEFDSWVGLIKYDSNALDTGNCLESYPVYGSKNQVVSHMSISGGNGDETMRVALCGNHSGAINVAGKEEQPTAGASQSSHCGYVIMPIKPL